MAVHIRLRRGGKKKKPHYRIVVADSRAPRDGQFIEIIGLYDPIPEVEEVKIEKDRLLYWLDKGAKPTDTVKSLLKRKGIWAELMSNGVSTAKPDIEIVDLQEELIPEDIEIIDLEDEIIPEEVEETVSEEIVEES